MAPAAVPAVAPVVVSPLNRALAFTTSSTWRVVRSGTAGWGTPARVHAVGGDGVVVVVDVGVGEGDGDGEAPIRCAMAVVRPVRSVAGNGPAEPMVSSMVTIAPTWTAVTPTEGDSVVPKDEKLPSIEKPPTAAPATWGVAIASTWNGVTAVARPPAVAVVIAVHADAQQGGSAWPVRSA